jgi:hypothetical protein
LNKLVATQGRIGVPTVNYDLVDQSYHFISQVSPGSVPFAALQTADPVINLSTTIDPVLNHAALNVLYGHSPPQKCADTSAKVPYYDGGNPSGKKLEAAIGGTLLMEGPLRLCNQTQLLHFREERKSMKAYFIKGHALIFQMQRAQRAGVQLQLQGINNDNCVVINQPVNQEGLVALNEQAADQSVALICPQDVSTASDRVCAHMLAAGGPVLTVVGDENVSVIDTVGWPNTPTCLVATSPQGQVPALVVEVPTAVSLMNFLQRVARNHGRWTDFEAAATEAAMIVGATWVVAPIAPVANAQVPYLPAQPPNDFDTLVELEPA